MEINLDDLKRILADGKLAVSLAGATCIHCNVVSRTFEAAKEHDASCEKHPMAARIAELETALAHQTKCRQDSDRLFMETNEALIASGYQLAEAREDSKRLTWAWEYPEAFITARRTTPPDLTGRQQIDAYRGKP